ncbi:putative transposase-associated domain-containing protein [Tanacetum coccineum]
MEKRNDHNSAGPKPINVTTEFVDDMDFAYIPTDGLATVEMVNATKDNFDVDDLVKFQELLLDGEKPLYEGCPDFTKFSVIVKLLNLKGKYGASDKFFTELLGLIKKMLPASNEMNDKDLTACRTCGTSRWKVDNKTKKMYENIPAKAWRTVDEKFPKITEDTRNLQLGISADGVDVNTGNRHHKPLVDDLHTLFETGVDMYDASTKDNFNLCAVMLWTINDYPALGTLCGCPYSRFKGCVVCGKDTNCVRLSASSKQSYVGHKRYLPYNHPFKKQKKAFNGQREFLQAPIPMTGEQIYNEVKHIENKWGKGKQTNNNASENQEDTRGRGEKNNAKSIVGTLLHVLGKTKDRLNARLDLAELGVKPELFAMQDEDKTTLPPTGYTLTNAEKDIFCETLHNIKVPEGYYSNFSSLVNLKDKNLIGLKSHDYHMLMQEFLPITIRLIMHPPTRYAIIRFCFFFKSICSKEIILQELDKMQAELLVTLCVLKKFFPPSFFDIMIHLTVHLTMEVKLCDSICFRWMYPFERCMKVIKAHVRNKNKPEGCIAEETIAEETIEFFSEYHKSMETIGIPPDKHETYENEEGKPLSAGKSSKVSTEQSSEGSGGSLFRTDICCNTNTNELVTQASFGKQKTCVNDSIAGRMSTVNLLLNVLREVHCIPFYDHWKNGLKRQLIVGEFIGNILSSLSKDHVPRHWREEFADLVVSVNDHPNCVIALRRLRFVPTIDGLDVSALTLALVKHVLT